MIGGTFSGSAASKTCEAPSEKRQRALAYSSGMCELKVGPGLVGEAALGKGDGEAAVGDVAGSEN